MKRSLVGSAESQGTQTQTSSKMLMVWLIEGMFFVGAAVLEGPFHGPSRHKVAALSDVIVFDCRCAGAPVEFVAFKISYGNMRANRLKCEETCKSVCTTQPPTEARARARTHIHTHTTRTECFAFQKAEVARGGGWGSMASGFPKSTCEVNE